MISLGALLIGAAVGVLTGLFGVGGGFLITPLLNAVLGVPWPWPWAPARRRCWVSPRLGYTVAATKA
jgi:uncharacterized membrane protein YfcA